jgi:hypothetical protein
MIITRKFISASILVGLSSFGAFPSSVYDYIEDEAMAERHAFVKSPVRLAVAIAAAEEATGAQTLSVQFIDDIDTMKYTVELTTAGSTKLIAEVDFSSYEVITTEV